jgi:hypothetical protein
MLEEARLYAYERNRHAAGEISSKRNGIHGILSTLRSPATNFLVQINYLEAMAPVASFSFPVQSVQTERQYAKNSQTPCPFPSTPFDA